MTSKPCAFCGETFSVQYPSQLHKRTYCGPDCATASSAIKRQNRVPLKCICCGKVFFVKKSHRTKRETCSDKCGGRIRSQRLLKHHPFRKPAHLHVRHRYRRVEVRGRLRYEHTVVAEAILGRKLRKNEVVHHKNGDKKDNRPDNLEVLTRSEHAKHHRPVWTQTK